MRQEEGGAGWGEGVEIGGARADLEAVTGGAGGGPDMPTPPTWFVTPLSILISVDFVC